MKILLTHFLMALAAIACGQEAPDKFPGPEAMGEYYPMRLTARIVDDNGRPVEGASVRLGIGNSTQYKDESNDFRGKSDATGKFSAEAPGNGTVEIEVTKDGCYISRLFHEKFERNPEKVRITKRYEPWDPTVDIVLKKIGKPIPMLVRLDDPVELPDVGKQFPFDLMAWDWLPPHGKGKVGDLLIRVDEQKEGGEVQSSSFKLRFANGHDGTLPIMELHGVESDFKSPRTAAEDGYDMRELFYEYRKGDKITTYEELEKRPKGYFLRIRTQVNAAGDVVSANYGKIIRTDLRMGGRRAISYSSSDGLQKPEFRFASCYINPTPNDRNLEYDRHHNLAPEAEPGGTWPP